MGLATREELIDFTNREVAFRTEFLKFYDEFLNYARDTDKSIFAFKYKMWEFNNYTNILFYEMYLNNAKKKIIFENLLKLDLGP